MERTERYDPEDLEQLMLERSFDELLEEERAFALRHLESRAEYERMRGLLRHLQQSAGSPPVMEADPGVREHVLEAFRAQQKPQWRIWLNSVGGSLFPQRPALYWRPALALGTLAVLTVTALMTYQAFEGKGNKQLAEVKVVQPAPPAPVQTPDRNEVAGTDDAATTVVAPPAATDEGARMPATHQPEEAKAAAPVPAARSEVTAESKALQETAAQDAPAATGIASAATDERTTTRKAEPASANSVDLAEDRNKEAEETISLKRSAYAEQSADKPNGTAYAEDDLLGLLQAAW